jgi:hypothetical protein
MVQVLVGLSIASLLTAMFAFRHEAGRNPRVLVGYFLLFFAFETFAEHFLVPPGALGIQVAYVCFALTIPFVAAAVIVRKLEEADLAGRAEPDSRAGKGAVADDE